MKTARNRHIQVVCLALGIGALFVLFTASSALAGTTIHVVAAENSYGSIVKTIGGDHVKITSLLDSPSVNPHEFKASPQIGRALTNADLVVMNGEGYDSWMDPLLNGTSHPHRQVIDASEVASALVTPDHNPHLFYSPRIMLVVASRVAQALTKMDPTNAKDYQAGLAHFQKQLLEVYVQVQHLIADHPNLTVTATVPVYSYMISLLGYRNLYHDIQFASMDDSQPSAQQVKQFIKGLQAHKVALLIYNVQVHNRLTKYEVQTAKEAGIPAVGVSELPLHGEDYAMWQITQLKAIEKALAHTGDGP